MRMDGDLEDTKLKFKHFSVQVTEVSTDDPNVEVISISKALVEILVKDPVCGRSDYSDLPGVRRDFQSPWRSFAEYPRRTNVRQRGNASMTSEEKHRRSYLARIRREKLTLQRVAKRERLRAQKQERNNQRSLLYKFQNQASENGECILLNPGVIISSPNKGSPGKLWKDNHRIDSKYYNKRDSDGIGRKSKCDGDFQKTLIDSQEKLNYSVSDSDDQLQTFLDEVVSTTSVHQADECIQKNSENFKCPTLKSEVPNLTYDKIFMVSNFLGESEENPVTSSQDSTEKSLGHSSLKSTPKDGNKPLVRTSWTVTSTTAPEIVDADSSTSRTLKRKTRNVKRVNYTEMLEDDDFDQDVDQQHIRESKTSGRKIRPVKRTLEKAIVDASMKKSPRKRKASVVPKYKTICLQPASTLITNTEAESNKLKQTIMPVAHADPNEKPPNHKVNMSSEYRLNELIPNEGSAKMSVHSLPLSAPAITQHHTLMCLSSGPHVSSAHNLHHTGSLPVKQLYLSNQFENNKPADVTLTCHSSLIPFNQQLYSTAPGLNITQNLASVIPSSSIQNPTFTDFSNFSLIMQPQFLKPLSVMNPHSSNRYLVSNFHAPQLNTQIHNISQQFTANLLPHPRGSIVCGMNQSVNSPPNFLLESQLPTPFQNNGEPISIGATQHVVRWDAASNKEDRLSKSTIASDISKADVILPVKNMQIHKLAPKTLGVPIVTKRQKKSLPNTGNMPTQERAGNMAQPFLPGLEKNLSQSGPAWHSLSATGSDSKDNASCKKQSQLDVETMLNSIHEDLTGGRNIVNSNNEIHKNAQQPSETASVQSKLSTDNIPTVGPRKIYTVADLLTLKVSPQSQPGNTSFPHTVPSSGSQVSCTTGQATVAQSCYQSLQATQDKSIGPPPPLISISELYNIPTNVGSYVKNQGDEKLPASYQNKHAAISVAHTIHPSSLTTLLTSFVPNERTSHQYDNSRERSAVNAQPSSTTQHQLINSLHQQSAQSFPPYPQLRHSYVQPCPDQARFAQENSGCKQAQLPKMPALLSQLNYSILTGCGNTDYRKNKLPVPELPHSFQIIPAPYHLLSPRITSSERLVAPRVITSLAQQLPTQIRSQLDNVSKTIGTHRLPSPRRPRKKQIRAIHQQVQFQNQKQALMPNTITSVITQPSPTTFQATCSSDFWRLPLFTQDHATQPMSGKSAIDTQYNNQTPQTSAENHFPHQSNQQRIPAETVKHSTACLSENTRDTHLPMASSRLQCPSSVNEDQQRLSYMNTQRVVDSMPNVPSTLSTNRVTMTLPCKSANVVIQGADTSSPSRSAVQTGKRMVVSSSGSSLTADSRPVNNSLLCGLDLSHKTSHIAQISVTTHTTSSASSAPTIVSLKQNQVTAAINTPRVAYDYPLTSVQIKQEFQVQSEQSETDNNGVVQSSLQKSQSSTTAGVTSVFSNHISVSTTSCVKGPISKQIIHSQEPIATHASVTTKPAVNSASSSLPVLGNINIKVEAHLGHGENTDSMSSVATPTTSLSQAPFLRNSQTSLITSVTTKPLRSSLSTYLKSIVDTTKNPPAGPVQHTEQTRHTGVCSQNNVPAAPLTVTATLPALVNIKQEIHSRPATEALTGTSVTQLQSSYLKSIHSSSNNTFLVSSAPINKALIPDTKSPFTASGSIGTTAIVSTEISHLNDQIPASILNQNHDGIPNKDNSSEPSANNLTVRLPLQLPSTPNKQTIGFSPKPYSFTNDPLFAWCIHSPKHLESFDIDDITISAQNSYTPPAMNTYTVTVSIPCTEANIPLPYTDSSLVDASVIKVEPNIQPATLNQREVIDLCVSDNDEEDPVNIDSFSYEFPTNSFINASCSKAQDAPGIANAVLPVSVPDLLPQTSDSHIYSMFVNSNQEVTNLGRTSVCASPGRVTNLGRTSVCASPGHFTNLDRTSVCASPGHFTNLDRTSVCASPGHFTNLDRTSVCASPGRVTNLDRTSVCASPGRVTNLDRTSVCASSGHFTNLDKTSVCASPGHTKSVAGQIIKSPLTGQNVVVSGEQMSYIRNRLARISGDLSSITTRSGIISTSANSVVSSVALHCVPPRMEAGRFSLDSVKTTSGSEQTASNKDPALIKVLSSLSESMCAPPLCRSNSLEQTKMIGTLEIDPENSSLAKEETHIVVIKKEPIEPICIDDDDDDDVVFITSTAGSQVSHLPCDIMKQTNNISRMLGRSLSVASSSLMTSQSAISPTSIATLFSSHKDQLPPSGSRSSVTSTSQSAGRVLASVGNWSDAQVAEWLKHHKLDKICPNLSSLDGRGLQRMAFEHQRDPDMFYTRVKKTLGLTFFQTMVICHSMKELNDNVNDDN